MATTTVLSSPYVMIGSTDFTDQCTSATVTFSYEALEATTFGDNARKFTTGLQNNEVTMTLMISYGAAEVEAALAAVCGTNVQVVIGAESATPSATNPVYTATMYLESFTPINASLGELQTVDLTFTGGALVRAVS
jgi:hypothetical protein